MTERLIKELQRIRLTLNAKKTKILMSNPDDGDYALNFVQIGNEFVKALNDTDCHRYLGRFLCTSASERIKIEIRKRQRTTWASIHKHKSVLLDFTYPYNSNSNVLMHVLYRRFYLAWLYFQ